MITQQQFFHSTHNFQREWSRSTAPCRQIYVNEHIFAKSCVCVCVCVCVELMVLFVGVACYLVHVQYRNVSGSERVTNCYFVHCVREHWTQSSFLGPFAKLWKATIISFVMLVCTPALPSVRPSVPMEQLGCHRTNVLEMWCLSIFRKSVEETQASFK